MYEIDKINYLQIGVQGENIARKIEIDMTKWVEELEADHVSGYTFGLVFKPYNDPNKHPMVTTYDEETRVLTWRVSADATQVSGVGYTEVRAQEATSGLVKKTRIIPTAVEDSVSGNETEPPESQEEWVAAVLNSAAAVLALAQGKQVKFEIDEDTGHLMLCYSDDEEVTVDTEWTTVDLGAVNAYAMAVLAGYTGTAAQFEQYMADIANGASSAAASASAAAASAAEAAQYTVDEIDDWLGDHITNPSNPPLDTSLSLSNAAAPANLVGGLKSAFINEATTMFGVKDLGTLVDGSYINKGTGGANSSSNWKRTDYIPVKGNALLFTCPNISGSTSLENIAAIAFYTSNSIEGFISGSVVSLINGTAGNLTWVVASIPATAKYYRVSIYKSSASNYQIIEIYNNIKNDKIFTVSENARLYNSADMHALQPNKIYYRSSSSDAVSNLPYDGWLGIAYTLRGVDADTAEFVVAISRDKEMHICCSWGSAPGTWKSWRKVLFADEFSGLFDEGVGYCGTYTGTFTTTKAFLSSGITMEANKTYRIKFLSKPVKPDADDNANLFDKDNSYSINDKVLRYYDSVGLYGIYVLYKFTTAHTAGDEWDLSEVEEVKKIQYGRVYVHGYGNSENYRFLMPWENELYFTNDGTARELRFYNTDGTAGTLTVKVYTADSISAKADDIPRVYKVAKNATDADFTSVTACFLALKDDVSPKIVEIWEGDYDIYQEYMDANVPVCPDDDDPTANFWKYCVFVPKNTHVIGRGVVRLKWLPDPSTDSITWRQCVAVSPVNVMGSMTLENVEIYCKNGRYCIHNDTVGLAPFAGSVQYYKNVKCYKNQPDADTTSDPGNSHNYGTVQTLGFGMGRSMFHHYENCEFHNDGTGRAFYGHTNQKYDGVNITEMQSGEIVMDNCIMETSGNVCVKLGNSGSVQRHVRVKFNDCYFNKVINAVDESGNGGTLSNAFDMTFMNCGEVSVHIGDASNNYPPKGYRTTITEV